MVMLAVAISMAATWMVIPVIAAITMATIGATIIIIVVALVAHVVTQRAASAAACCGTDQAAGGAAHAAADHVTACCAERTANGCLATAAFVGTDGATTRAAQGRANG